MTKPYVTKCPDGSILIEFVNKDWRFGISLEKDRKESSWYLVDKKRMTNKDFEENMGTLPEEFLNLLKPGYQWDCTMCGAKGTMASDRAWYDEDGEKLLPEGWCNCPKCKGRAFAEPALKKVVIGSTGLQGKNKM